MYSFFRRTIPVGSVQNSRSLSLIFSVLIFLLSFVATCVFLFSQGFHKWERGNSYKVTVEIPVDLQSINNQEQITNKVMQELNSMPEVLKIQRVDPEKLKAMLTLWAGDKGISNTDLHVPVLLDVEFNSSNQIDIENIKQKLRQISMDINIENHNTWAQKLVVFGKSLKLVTMVIGSFILLCTIIIVILVTKSALQAYYSTLDILRLLGAKNAYIARIFQNQILKSSFYGGICGVCLSIPTVYAFVIVLKYLGLEGLTWSTMLWHITIVVIGVPIIVAFIGVLVSRITVHVHLRLLDKKTSI
ncbi:MAG: hypothetical protein LBD36_03085 [Holosporales bacterium]|jgi:cell division transport system permease protein|nr:hypothetical protein [Holosporales bacterium]